MSDDRLRSEALERLRPRPYVRTAGAAEDAAEADALWPRFNDPYRAAGKPENHEIPRLVVVMGKDGFKPGATAYHILQYPHIGSAEFGFDADGQWFRVPFYEMRRPRLLSACGRGILRYCDYIGLRRMPWIRMSDRDFQPGDGEADDAPIFTRIEVTDLPKEDE
jgi:hypothetical protein